MKIVPSLFLIFDVAVCPNPNAADSQTFVRDFYAAYKARDAVRMGAIPADTLDATFVDPSFELDLKGPDQIRDLFNKVFPKYASLDFEIAIPPARGTISLSKEP